VFPYAGRNAARWRDNGRIDRQYHTPANLLKTPELYRRQARLHPSSSAENPAIAAGFTQGDAAAGLAKNAGTGFTDEVH
jgi:hypothetical protein